MGNDNLKLNIGSVINAYDLVHGFDMDRRMCHDPLEGGFSKFNEMMSEVYAELDRQPEPNEKDLMLFRNTALGDMFPKEYKDAWKKHRGFPYQTLVEELTHFNPWTQTTIWMKAEPKMTLKQVIEADSGLNFWDLNKNYGHRMEWKKA